MVFSFVFRNKRWAATASRVLAFTDKKPVNKHREAVAVAFKRSCRRDLRQTPFNLYHHPEESNYWLQVADYCCWAVQRKWEQGDSRTYDGLWWQLAMQEFDVLRHGNTHYYRPPVSGRRTHTRCTSSSVLDVSFFFGDPHFYSLFACAGQCHCHGNK